MWVHLDIKNKMMMTMKGSPVAFKKWASVTVLGPLMLLFSALGRTNLITDEATGTHTV